VCSIDLIHAQLIEVQGKNNFNIIFVRRIARCSLPNADVNVTVLSDIRGLQYNMSVLLYWMSYGACSTICQCYRIECHTGPAVQCVSVTVLNDIQCILRPLHTHKLLSTWIMCTEEDNKHLRIKLHSFKTSLCIQVLVTTRMMTFTSGTNGSTAYLCSNTSTIVSNIEAVNCQNLTQTK
jgi:hypothetical protein